MRYSAVALSCAVYVALASQVSAQASYENVLRCKVRNGLCIITSNGGGVVREFENAVNEARARGVRIRIAGFCGSACATVVATSDIACVVATARFVYHRGTHILARNHIPGLPFWTGDERHMNAREAIREKGLRRC